MDQARSAPALVESGSYTGRGKSRSGELKNRIKEFEPIGMTPVGFLFLSENEKPVSN